jgi:alpha-tubulin suppressor-like RCC1 family protein
MASSAGFPGKSSQESQYGSYMERIKNSWRAVSPRSLPGGPKLCAVAVAALFLAGCSLGHASAQMAAARSTVAPSPPPTTSTVERWGSFFADGLPNTDTAAAPVKVTLPGTVAEVGSSNSTEYALLTNGSLYAWGLGAQGELGDGNLVNSPTRPVRVDFPRGVKIAYIPTDVMPYDTALAVDTKGQAWGWGDNAFGELCLGDNVIRSVPVKLPFSHVTSLAGAADHDLYDADGTVYACGQNVEGDLGSGNLSSTTTPVRVAGLDGSAVVQLVTSFANSGALLSNGQYYDWGYDGHGQLGDGSLGLSSDRPVRVPLPHRVMQVALGGSVFTNGQTIAMLSDGSLWSWGDNHGYQLGSPATAVPQALPMRFTAPKGVTYKFLATGAATSYAISTTGNVYAWGVSYEGQAGDGNFRIARVPVLIARGATQISATANNAVINVPRKK